MQNMTQGDALITKNYIWANLKNQILRSKIFGQKLRWKKFLWYWKIELAKNAGYDQAWSAHHEKLYLSLSKNQFWRSKFVCQKLRLKKFV